MYQTIRVCIRPKDELYDYCDGQTRAANNLYNASLYRVRQVLTMFNKPAEELTDNEKNVYNEIASALPIMGYKYKMPSKGKTFLSYEFLDALFKATKNPDYFCHTLQRQTAQHTIKTVVRSMKSFYEAKKAYRKDPSKFLGEPQLPNYHKKGGKSTAILTNQDCNIRETKTNHYSVKLPLTKSVCNIGVNNPGRLKQVTITPFHNVFYISSVFENDVPAKAAPDNPKRLCGIDLGVDNVASITNNTGAPCLLFKGGVIKSANQRYNKLISEIKSSQTTGTTEKFKPTPESDRLCVRRKNILFDFMHKVGKNIITWCVDNQMEGIIIGHSNGWKQNSNIGKHNNQNFVSIPFEDLSRILKYLAEREGIMVIDQEESYTSQASFLDHDFIPVYGATDGKPVFSGKRLKRGNYRSKDGTIINADLNGSANISRKALPDVFTVGIAPDFSNTIIVKHPDWNSRQENRLRQSEENHQPGKAKLRRDLKRNKRNPYGIVAS